MKSAYYCEVAQHYVLLKQHLTLYSKHLFTKKINKTIKL